MASRELSVSVSQRIATLIPQPWLERYRAARQIRIDARDQRARDQKEANTQREIARIERRLSHDLSRELRTQKRRLIMRLTELEIAYYYRSQEKAGRIRAVKFAQMVATPSALYFRLDTVHMPRGVRTAMIEDPQVIQDMSLAAGAPVTTYQSPENGFWIIIERSAGLAAIPNYVEYVDALVKMPQSAGPLDVPLGIGANHRFHHIDIATCPHLLIAGATGFGKSVFLHNIVSTLIQRATPKQVALVICDLKGGTELGAYSHVPHLYNQAVTDDADAESEDDDKFVLSPRIYSKRKDIQRVLNRLFYIVEHRLQLFTRERVRDLNGWNFKHRGGLYMPRIVCVIDEIANVMLDKNERPEVERLLADIAARGRAPGVHLVVATQRPSVDVITGLIKANFPARVAFNTASQVDSRVILDHAGAHGLGTPGRLYYQNESSHWICQSPFVSEALVDDIVERVMAGTGSIAETGHAVGTLDLAAWAIDHNGGQFSIDAIYREFRDRGITHRDVRDISASLTGKIFEHDGKFYRLEPGRGPNPRQFNEVEHA